MVVVGELPYAEKKGDRRELSLEQTDAALIAKAKAVGVPVVTIIYSGRPLVLGNSLDQSTALVAAWLPGTEGEGISDVLFGDYNPTGKLCVTWPASNNQEPINAGNMGDNVGAGGTPLFAYGFGLSYP